jgi:hypothetical protein
LKRWRRNFAKTRPEVPKVHANRQPFRGVLTLVDMPSDKAPTGARGHRVVLTRRAAAEALDSLIGMAVGYKAGWDGHDARQKVGIITEADILGQEVVVRGFLFAKDFPELKTELAIEPERMGMSYELADCHVPDMRATVWPLTRVTFTGAAILLKEHAAYKETSFTLLDQASAPAFDARGFSGRMVAAMQGVAE